MYVIKVKNTNNYCRRKPYKLVSLQEADTYKSEAAAKTAIKATITYGLPENHLKIYNINSEKDIEIVEVELKLK